MARALLLLLPSLLLLALVFYLTTPVMAAEVDVDIGAIGLHTWSGKTLAGVALGVHVIPTSDTNKAQDWAADHITLDILQTGSSLDATTASLGMSLNLLAPEANVKLGATYLWAEKEPAVYLGWSRPIK
jgi:hypothetical protein